MTKTVTLHAQQKWEYQELTRKTETYLLKELNEAGQDGWELVSVTHSKDLKGELTWTAFLKRPYAGHGHPATNQHAQAEAAGLHERKVIQPQPSGAAMDDGEELRFQEE